MNKNFNKEKAILIAEVKNYYNYALGTYLEDTYPDYLVRWVDRDEIADGILGERNPQLLVIPGGIDSAYFKEKGMPQISAYFAGGGNLLAVCSGIYNCLPEHFTLKKSGGIKNHMRSMSLRLFHGSSVFKERDDECEPKHNSNFDSYGDRMKAFYFNGPYISPFVIRAVDEDGRKRHVVVEAELPEEARPFLNIEQIDGKRSPSMSTLMVVDGPNGGHAVLSTNHIESPFERQIDMHASIVRFLLDRCTGRARICENEYTDALHKESVDFHEKLEKLYREHLYQHKAATERIQAAIYEDILGLGGRARG